MIELFIFAVTIHVVVIVNINASDAYPVVDPIGTGVGQSVALLLLLEFVFIVFVLLDQFLVCYLN